VFCSIQWNRAGCQQPTSADFAVLLARGGRVPRPHGAAVRRQALMYYITMLQRDNPQDFDRAVHCQCNTWAAGGHLSQANDLGTSELSPGPGGHLTWQADLPASRVNEASRGNPLHQDPQAIAIPWQVIHRTMISCRLSPHRCFARGTRTCTPCPPAN